jgi:tRNA/tmRNA/rRNA uracil-C5-methylase (TrmA/RlmC/RlmD family)
MAGVEFAVAPVIGSPREFGYRSKITPHFRAWPVAGRGEAGSPGSATPATTNPIGFLKQGTRFDLIDVPRCEIATEEINAKLPEVRERTRQRLAAGEYKRDATLLLRHAQEGVVTDYDAVIHEKVGELRLHFLARDFFQNNPFILPAFTGYVREQAAGSGAKFLVDAYCGSGLFALSCAPAFERVAGIELSETSIKFATENAAANGIANATFRAGDAAQIFAGLDFAPTDTAVVIDPPRKGCDESVPEPALRLRPARRRLCVLRPGDADARSQGLPRRRLPAHRRAALRPVPADPPPRVRDHAGEGMSRRRCPA